jgi:hypothetical protein
MSGIEFHGVPPFGDDPTGHAAVRVGSTDAEMRNGHGVHAQAVAPSTQDQPSEVEGPGMRMAGLCINAGCADGHSGGSMPADADAISRHVHEHHANVRGR